MSATNAVEVLRTGSWLTRERIRRWALALLAAYAIGFTFLVATSDGLNDFRGRPLGTDFSTFYAAGSFVLEGDAAASYDWPALHARERAIFGDAADFYGWYYPPFFLFVAAALALAPYAASLLLWQVVTLALYLGMLALVLRAATDGDRSGVIASDRLWLLLALAFPAVFVNIGHGHNGFLTAALLGGALVQLERRPALAGVLLGLMAYKPQFGLLIPLVLVATGRWRAIGAATLTVAALSLATAIALGPESWRAFFASTHLTRVEVLEQGGLGWHKIQSVFSIVRMWGGGVPLAYALQGAFAVAVALCVVALWRSSARYPLKAAALVLGLFLVTPYGLDYDLVALAPAIAFLAADGLARGFGPWQKSALAALWLVPILARTAAEWALLPLAISAMALVLALTWNEARRDGVLAVRWKWAAPATKQRA